MTTRTLLLIGGTSDIGRATALRYAQEGWRVMLAARNDEEAQRNGEDIAARTGAEVTVHRLDILETESFTSFLDKLPHQPDTAVCVVGELGDQVRAQSDPDHARLLLRTNFEGPALLLGILAERFLERRSGAIVGVSSVAGDRGRASNYLYGAAKAGFTAFLSGLRNRLAPEGIRVVTVKPGFVRTQMTAGMKLPPLLTAEPQEVGAAIYEAAERGRGDVIYVRRLWRPVMMAIRFIPEPLFKRLKL
ncbi:SDR family oxidoreductase [Microvirga arsenatis]|uniref:SDR family oxidoreductase n=1 Tax=Microvirga arsenatis TaxID=2692265 RepID=A0ABW9YVU9_9HYPH|nr:SDR family oxidoreductase [Microvirga arsenatis]NBJ10909.1 SDR family oxidoreductase [Microvirga arsenatis]NBJ24193.1 SDR family oxidoreductase [Microvirga arsenatis]